MPNKDRPLDTQGTLTHASDVSHLETLSRPAKATLSISAVIFLGISIYSSLTAALLLPVILTPTLLFLRYRSSLPAPHRGTFETLVWAYLGTATLSTALLILLQSVLAYGSAHILFGKDRDWFVNEFQTVGRESDIRDDAHRAQRAEFAGRPGYWVFMLIMTFVLAGLSEEVQKYISISLAVRYEKRNAREKRGSVTVSEKEYLVYGANAGLAFATIEMYMFLVAGAAKSTSYHELARTVAERFCIGMAAHLLCGLSTALNMIRRDFRQERFGLLRVVMRSALCHGGVNFGLMAFSALKGDVSWVQPEYAIGTVTCLGMSASGIALLGWLVRKSLRAMDLKVE